jgi:N-glycosylase/DNA lyase
METNTRFVVREFDLATTLNCGQAFRWTKHEDGWEGVVRGHWTRLCQLGSSVVEATTAVPQSAWVWLAAYLRLDDDFEAIRGTFPDDAPMRAALAHSPGLRLLRQEPWECLASFILSSTKQIPQIRQCIGLLCERLGEPIPTGSGVSRSTIPAMRCAFPTAARLAAATESELRACNIGFRAKYLASAAQRVASRSLDLDGLSGLPLEAARAELMRCPGVGPKIADCVLLFSCGFDAAFPIDVWVERALSHLYFPAGPASRSRMSRFAASYFGPHAGYAQQYLFHYLRTGETEAPSGAQGLRQPKLRAQHRLRPRRTSITHP